MPLSRRIVKKQCLGIYVAKPEYEKFLVRHAMPFSPERLILELIDLAEIRCELLREGYFSDIRYTSVTSNPMAREH